MVAFLAFRLFGGLASGLAVSGLNCVFHQSERSVVLCVQGERGGRGFQGCLGTGDSSGLLS